jgi:hypothetical protein
VTFWHAGRQFVDSTKKISKAERTFRKRSKRGLLWDCSGSSRASVLPPDGMPCGARLCVPAGARALCPARGWTLQCSSHSIRGASCTTALGRALHDGAWPADRRHPPSNRLGGCRPALAVGVGTWEPPHPARLRPSCAKCGRRHAKQAVFATKGRARDVVTAQVRAAPRNASGFPVRHRAGRAMW